MSARRFWVTFFLVVAVVIAADRLMLPDAPPSAAVLFETALYRADLMGWLAALGVLAALALAGMLAAMLGLRTRLGEWRRPAAGEVFWMPLRGKETTSGD
jgi:hypothetical protein